jgi:serine/threonine protein kinase
VEKTRHSVALSSLLTQKSGLASRQGDHWLLLLLRSSSALANWWHSFPSASTSPPRDIKPGNLLLSSSGHLKISDFGVSSQLSSSMSKCLSWVGTVTYMSPERIRGDSYSFNTDVWSLGLVLVECALGRCGKKRNRLVCGFVTI